MSIFSIAHLDDGQRMFFVALLLNAIAGWMRTQTGHVEPARHGLHGRDLRVLSAGREPAVESAAADAAEAGARAGLGVVLATQNPVDLDYKGLSNIGTWWLGRLQTDRDKARVLDGLESANDSGGFDRAEIDRLLSVLTSRVFLMRNVHEDRLTLFQSRWALSYLRGPLGRDDIKKLTAGRKRRAATRRGSASTSSSAATSRSARCCRRVERDVASGGSARHRHSIFRPMRPRRSRRRFGRCCMARSNVRFVDPKLKVDTTKLGGV